jgi:hypothetical protein
MRLGSRTTRSIPIEIGDKTYTLAQWKRDDWKAWGDKLDARRMEEAIRDVSDPQLRARITAYFPQAPFTLPDLLARVDTTWGTDEIVSQALLKAGVPADQIQTVLDNTDHNDLHQLAVGLIGIGTDALAEKQQNESAAKSFPGSSTTELKVSPMT